MPNNKKELMEYRLCTAEERLNSAGILLEAGSYKDSIGRSYYAMFTAVRAVLALDGVDYSKHAGVIAYFQKEYVKTGVFEKKYSKYLSTAFQIRNNTDYADFFVVSQEDAKEQYEKATEFYEEIKKYLEKKDIFKERKQ
ncbi:MAG: HEPN domain-containing protein [Lachnospiraceae bacterium]|nr:HEPN domain-containing protein [Lachnospiraceae bacterium]